jgi:NADP-dependent aldehyde dehydrogenase
VVFGASNFPFAYSTAGGDTACALAAGCTVLIKAHPAHAETSEMVAAAFNKAAQKNNLPQGVFIHLHGASFEVGKALVQHPLTKAVGFTGSFEGGKALFDLANQRPIPIPVFAEMGSVNPVFLLPLKLKKDTELIASMYASSITQSAGQFCTNPGILVGIEDESLNTFKKLLGGKIQETEPVKMLHSGIAKSFYQKREKALAEEGVGIAAVTAIDADVDESIPTLAEVPAEIFLKNHLLHKEVFGPYSLLVKCRNVDEMLQVALHLEGQLTTSLMATDEEVQQYPELVEALQDLCGRFVLNGVPTGVEVALAMHHGGPFPATTDSRFTAVGSDGIKRFARPVCYQNWTDELLPDELKNENPLELWRTINNGLTKGRV